MLRRSFIISLILLLTACGFHLRGSQGTTALSFKTLSVVSESDSLVAQSLIDLMRGQVQVVTGSAQVTVELSVPEHSKTILTKDAQGRASEYRLYSKVTMQAYAVNKDQLISPVTLTVTRTLSTGNGYDTGLDLEEARLYADMDATLANQIQYRLRALQNVR